MWRGAMMLAFTCAALVASGDVVLQTAFDAAGPGAGYDKLLILDPVETYTGGLSVSSGKNAVWGSGNVVNLGGSSASVQGGARLDLHGMVFIGGTTVAVNYVNGTGRVEHCTFYGNGDAIQCSTGTNTYARSDIFSYSSRYGVLTIDEAPTWLAYNCAYSNASGNYYNFCPG